MIIKKYQILRSERIYVKKCWGISTVTQTLVILLLIEARNDAMRYVFNRRIHQSASKIKQDCKNLKASLHEANSKLIKQIKKVLMRITESENWNKISLGCNKHSKKKIVKKQNYLHPSGWNAQMVHYAELQKKFLKYPVIIFEHV